MAVTDKVTSKRPWLKGAMVNKIIDKTDLIKPEVPFYKKQSGLSKVQGLIQVFEIGE